ncbi:class F sortase [Blastococcus sp. TBT05-19]|uniref:class F sortase n=1 Tax=Blastococcus sp. TBT05-19 TaxID=2250581 RepID=UPI000DEB0CA9|nr:class F sortase [Blastococcus sp. TBT05-19]RBY94685.1 class F sortase [Blastococcus sp. TBT05-19]
MRLKPLRPRAAVLSGAAALGVCGAVLIGVGLADGDATAHAVPVVADDGGTAAPTSAPPAPTAGPTATPSPTPVALRTPSSDVHVRIGSVDLDLPVLPLQPKRGVVDPPTLTAAYWLEPYGRPVGSADQAENTLYIAAHSAGRGDNGFDPLLTADHRGAAVAAGDTVEVVTPQGTVTYTVDRTERVPKGELADATDVWEAVPGRLVLITCFQRADGRNTTENLVVFAHS